MQEKGVSLEVFCFMFQLEKHLTTNDRVVVSIRNIV